VARRSPATEHRSIPHSANKLTVAVTGFPVRDDPTDTTQYDASPAFIDSINGDPKVDLVLHVGDIHSGKQFCTEAYDEAVYDLWTEFKDPLGLYAGRQRVVRLPQGREAAVATTGRRSRSTTSRDPAGSTNYVDYALRATRSPTSSSSARSSSPTRHYLGGRKKQVLSQAEHFDPAHPADAKFVENVMWEQSKVVS